MTHDPREMHSGQLAYQLRNSIDMPLMGVVWTLVVSVVWKNKELRSGGWTTTTMILKGSEPTPSAAFEEMSGGAVDA